jgi:hypothetical protein
VLGAQEWLSRAYSGHTPARQQRKKWGRHEWEMGLTQSLGSGALANTHSRRSAKLWAVWCAFIPLALHLKACWWPVSINNIG